MESQTKKVLQIILLFVVIIGLLIWWALYRMGIFSGPNAQRQTEIMKTLDKNNNDFLKLLEKNADFLATSTQGNVPTPPQATSTNQ